MTMAGNTVYVQGNYVDVHDNAVVNLSIDKATLKVAEAEIKPSSDLAAASSLISNSDFMTLMDKAVNQGFCTRHDQRFCWKVKAEAAYFASLASHRFALSDRHDHDGDLAISWKPFEVLFGIENLRLAYNDYKQCKTTLRRKAEIDNLFR